MDADERRWERINLEETTNAIPVKLSRPANQNLMLVLCSSHLRLFAFIRGHPLQ
jgi:hypothetical protein